MSINSKHMKYLLVTLIILLAAFMRVNDLGITEFKRDEANLSRLALDMAQGTGCPITWDWIIDWYS